jgi:hypothetical protein
MPTIVFADTTATTSGAAKHKLEWNDLQNPQRAKAAPRAPRAPAAKKASRRCCPGPAPPAPLPHMPPDLQLPLKFDPGERSPTVSMGSSCSMSNSSCSPPSSELGAASASSVGDPMEEGMHGQWAHDVLSLEDPLSMIADVPASVRIAASSAPLVVLPVVVADPVPGDGIQHVHVRPAPVEHVSPALERMDTTNWEQIDVDAEFSKSDPWWAAT